MNGSRFAYVDLLNDLIRKLNPSAIKRIVLRPYRGSEIWDDPFTSLLDHDVRVEVDTTFPPIQDRFDDARLVVSTSLGTTFFQTLHQQIPTAILLDREMSAVCDEANDALSELERGSILFADTTRLASHLNSVFLDVDSWWWNATTQQCIYEFESVLSPSTSTPTSFYGSVLRVARTGWVV
jgi:putative transferase (TIGR04331 family)